MNIQFFNKSKPRAKIVDSAIVFSLPDADTPRVWRYNLSQTEISGFEVVEKDGSYQLVMIAPDTASDHNRVIASYKDIPSARYALDVLAACFMKAQTVTTDTLGSRATRLPRRIRIWRWIAVAAVLGALYFLSFAGSQTSPNIDTASDNEQVTTDGRPAKTLPPPGQPVAADDFFGE